MTYRSSIPNAYQSYPSRMNNLEPIPMTNTNRRMAAAPQPVDPRYYGSTLSARSTRPLLAPPYNNNPSTSCWSQPCCLGLTRLSGGILFTTMIVLAAGSIAGLIVAVVFYVNDPTTDSQWKILGMVVSAIMLLTVLVTFCIFIYCYQQGRIIGSTNPHDPFKTQQPFNSHNRDLDQTYPPPYYQPGMVTHQMISPIPYPEETIPVHDKLTNTQQTNAPFPPRDLQRGVWPSNNAYGGYAYRPTIPPKTFSRTIQASPTQFDQNQNSSLRKNPNNTVPIPRARIEYIEDDEYDRARRQRRALENPRYEIIEEVHHVVPTTTAGRNGKDRSRFDRVTVKPISVAVEKPIVVQDEFTTDHFYQ